jgi:hydroxymethylbilane synthase
LNEARLLRIGTRGSRLALWQADAVAAALASHDIRTERIIIRTTGDKTQTQPASYPESSQDPSNDTKRQFVKELEDALLAEEIDVAVHSAKDLPVDLPDGLVLSGCLPREDPLDALVLPSTEQPASFHTLRSRIARGAVIGTGSIRRSAQLIPLLPGVSFAPIRGNVDTRVRKLDAGEFDALVLACAGLRRLGLDGRISAAIPLEQCVPAPGQGIVATEIRAGDEYAQRAVTRIADAAAAQSLQAERAIVVALGGGCQLPLGALARHRDGALEMHAVVASADGARIVRTTLRGATDAPEELGQRMADALAAQGARDILAELERP